MPIATLDESLCPTTPKAILRKPSLNLVEAITRQLELLVRKAAAHELTINPGWEIRKHSQGANGWRHGFSDETISRFGIEVIAFQEDTADFGIATLLFNLGKLLPLHKPTTIVPDSFGLISKFQICVLTDQTRRENITFNSANSFLLDQFGFATEEYYNNIHREMLTELLNWLTVYVAER